MKDAMRELTPIVGGVSAVATIELTEWHAMVKIAIGVATLVYLGFRIGWAYKEFKNK